MNKPIKLIDVELNSITLKQGKGGYRFTIKGILADYPNADFPKLYSDPIGVMTKFEMSLARVSKMELLTKADRQTELEFNKKQTEMDVKPKEKTTEDKPTEKKTTEKKTKKSKPTLAKNSKQLK